jgi:hypothetical protein
MVDPIQWRKGMTITEPGVYSGVPMSVYHSQKLCDGPSISSSGLRKIFNESPAHFYAYWDGNPDREDDGDTAAFTLGRAAHHLLLGEDDFSTAFIQRPEEIGGKPWQGNRTECKDWIKAQVKAGRTVLTPEQIKTIRGMAKSLAAHPLVKAGILNGAVEQSMVWRCKDTGIWKKARPDCTPNDSGDFADLKTCVSVHTDEIQRTIYDHGYAQQGALICEAWKELTGSNASSFSLVFVEKSPPYCCRVVTLRDEDLIRAERANYAAAQTFANCLETGEWPGPGNADAEYIYLAEWMTKKMDFRIEQIEAREAI